MRYRVAEAMKGVVYQIAAGVTRYKGYFDWVLSRLVEGPIKKEVRYLLWMSLYQIAFMKKAHYHVVKEAVEYTKRQRGAKVGNFVNAVLRRFLRERDGLILPRDPIARLSTAYSFPGWLVRRWLLRFGEDETERLLGLMNETPRFSVRVKETAVSREDAARELGATGAVVSPGEFVDSCLHVDRLGPVLASPLFRDGLIAIQDEASQLAVSAVRAGKGDSILDACAGLGTKTAQLAASFPGSSITAMDTSMKRLSMMEGKFDRVRASGLQAPFREESFDCILLDAPCSSMGILRKHPEIRWTRKEADLRTFADYQLDLLGALWHNLRAGGSMVYSVCSFEPEETVGVVERFRAGTECLLEPPLPHLSREDWFLSLPQETGMDGFFIARLKKL